MDYPSGKADILELYVRRKNILSRMAHHVYVAIRWLEITNGVRLCGRVIAPYRDIVYWAKVNDTSVKKALLEIRAAGLAAVVIGDPNKAKKQATEIQRKTLEEIKAQSRQGDSDACRLAAALVKRSFHFGNKVINPSWTPRKSDRLYSSNPNIQGMPHDVRWEGLKAGVKEGLALVHADIKQAEPSIIKHLLRMPQSRDLYQEFMDATGCSRTEAKDKINTLNYCRNSLACFKYWSEPAQAALGDYVHELAAYKKDLFVQFRKNRNVRTLAGRLIEANKGCRHHKGIPMNWLVQGTVADIVNPACLRLLDFIPDATIIPVHDAIYAIIPSDKASLVETVIIEKAREMGIAVKVDVKVYPCGLATSKTTTAKTTPKHAKLSPKPLLITTTVDKGMVVDSKKVEVER